MAQDCIDTIDTGSTRRVWLWGAVGVVAFSFTLLATRLAVSEIDGTRGGAGPGPA